MRKILPLAALVLLAACGRDATHPAAEGLSPAETRALAGELAHQLGSGVLTPLGSQPGPQNQAAAAALVAASGPVEIQATLTAPCPRGGSVKLEARVSGMVDEPRRSVTLNTTATLTHGACAVAAEGTTLTLDGAPNLVAQSSVSVVDGKPAGLQTASLKGGLAWRTADGRAGTCQVDLGSSVDADARTSTVLGRVCGTQVEVKTSWT